MCDERLWQFIAPLLGEFALQHIVLPMEDTIDAIVESLSQSLPDEPINLLGFSMGGYLASAFSVKYPARIKQLMVISNTATGLREREIIQRKQALNWVRQYGYKGIPNKKALAMIGEQNKKSDCLLQVIRDMDAHLGEAVLVQQLSSSLERPSLLSALEQLAIEVCFCLGDEDSVLSPEVFNSLRSHHHFRYFSAKHCGHMVPLEQPVWCAQHISMFFRC